MGRSQGGLTTEDPCSRRRQRPAHSAEADGRVVLAPQDKHRRAMFPEPGLPRRIGRDVGLIVEKQIGLDLALAGPRQQRNLPFPCLRVVALGMRG
jgi:hypothetical protein